MGDGEGQVRRRADDGVGGYIVKYWPLILSLFVLVGAAYVTREDVQNAKADIKDHAGTIREHEKRLIRVEEAIGILPEMRGELKEINKTLSRIASRRND